MIEYVKNINWISLLPYALGLLLIILILFLLRLGFFRWIANTTVSFWYFLFPQKHSGYPCYVLAKSAGISIGYIEGYITSPIQQIVDKNHPHIPANIKIPAGLPNTDNNIPPDIESQVAGDITYIWKDGVEHTFIGNLDNYIGIDNGRPVYAHNVGALYGAGVTQLFIDSDFYNKIRKSSLGRQVLEYLEDLREQEQTPWLKYALWAALAIGAILLIKSGALNQVWQQLVPPGTPPAPTANITPPFPQIQ